MVNLRKFLKAYRDARAFHALFAPHRFIDESVFLTKSNQLGIVLGVEGTDHECLTDGILESYSTRVAAAWRSFDEQFRLYQYVIKQDHAPVEQRTEYANAAVRETVQDRRDYLQSKPEGLYTLRVIYILLFEPPTVTGNNLLKRTLSNRKVLRVMADELERNRATLLAHAESFQRNIGNLLGITILPKAE